MRFQAEQVRLGDPALWYTTLGIPYKGHCKEIEQKPNTALGLKVLRVEFVYKWNRVGSDLTSD